MFIEAKGVILLISKETELALFSACVFNSSIGASSNNPYVKVVTYSGTLKVSLPSSLLYSVKEQSPSCIYIDKSHSLKYVDSIPKHLFKKYCKILILSFTCLKAGNLYVPTFLLYRIFSISNSPCA